MFHQMDGETMKILGQTSREELMELSLDAAIEIERAILGHSIDAAKIRNMIAALGSAFRPTASGQSHFVDPRVVSVYGRAARSLGNSQVTTVQAVKDWVDTVSKKHEPGSGPQGDLPQLRDFLLALHRELVADVVPDPSTTSVRKRPSYDLAKHSSVAG
jgi:hypothetical protein